MRRSLVVLVCLALTACSMGGADRTARTPVAPAHALRAPEFRPRADGSIRVGPHAQTGSVLFAGGSVWASAYGGVPQRFWVARVDPSTVSIRARVRTEGGPTWVVGGGGMAYGGGSLWVMGDQRTQHGGVTTGAAVNRIDPVTDRMVASIALPDFAGADVAVARGGVWAATFDGTCHGPRSHLVLVDPRKNRIRRLIRLAARYVRGVVVFGGVVVVDERYWTGRRCERAGPFPLLESFDATTGRRLALSKPHGDAWLGSVLRWRDQLWAESADGAVRLDPRSLSPIGEAVRRACCFLAASREGIWLSSEMRHRLGFFDPMRRSITWFGDIDAGANAAAAGPHALWLLDYDGMLRKIALGGSG
jgi:hypothetical protein